MQPEKHEDGKPADERDEISTIRLTIRRAAQTKQKLGTKECRGEQNECGYVVAEGSVLSVAVVLELRSAGLGVLKAMAAAKLTTWRPNSHPGESLRL